MFRRGFIQIPLLVGFVMMAIALPVANKLVQTNQENRGQAAAKVVKAPTTAPKVCVEGMLDWCTYRYKDCKTEYRCTQAPVKATKKPETTSKPTNKEVIQQATIKPTIKISPTKVASTSNGEYKLNMTYNCGTHKCAWNQKAQHWIVENDPYKSKIVCVDDSSCKFVPTPTSYMQKTCVQWKLDGNGKCIGYEIKLYHTQAEGVVCERDYASNCDINKPLSTIAPTIKVLISPTAAKSPTPTINWKRVVSLCQAGVDYNHDGTANSLDMLKCIFEN